MTDFAREVDERIAANASNAELKDHAHSFMRASLPAKYSYNFSWLGRPIIQYPQDILAVQEIVWRVQPDLIVETGIAHGGSLILYASLLELNASCGGPDNAKVVGVDVDIRSHNREAILAHPLAHRISMIQGSSIATDTIEQVRQMAAGYRRILVSLDSNHTHDHVLAELEAYARLTSVGSYCIVFDTIVEHMPAEMFTDRPWAPGDNPKTALDQYLSAHREFQVDRAVDDKVLISVAPGGFLQRISE